MSIVDDIFAAFGGNNALAEATRIAPQTVSDWRRKGSVNIPPWRRRDVLDAAQRLSISLPPEAVEYLSGETASEARAA
ncbi:hypothetical protein UFOVP407_37 [uncultured Caudovirales phage]|uniref:Uncharacterized protein n=1 Tax=uncultured Caudovirales phage TaxID=2100421 RepID=A0A6J5M586_9CAUD|nr:hypothetical protein UFOVP407_37 [uncultured Caudovirales phage]